MRKGEEKIYGQVPKELTDVARVVRLMDSSIKIPFSSRTIGVEPLIGLIPVVGDSVGFIVEMVVMVILLRNNGSGKVAAKMGLNILVDIILSVIPVLGNVLDFFVKTNQRNLTLAVEHFQYGKNQGSAWTVILPIILGLVLFFVLSIIGLIMIIYYLISLF